MLKEIINNENMETAKQNLYGTCSSEYDAVEHNLCGERGNSDIESFEIFTSLQKRSSEINQCA